MNSNSHPSDWIATNAPFLSDLETALICVICKNLLTAPILTNCCHTFCSVCIRKQVTVENRCPTCRTELREGAFRKESQLEDAVLLFKKNREALMRLATKEANSNAEIHQEADQKHPVSTRREGSRRTRSTTKYDEPSEIEDGEDSNQNAEEGPFGNCPICNEYLPIRDLETTHFDYCGVADASQRQPILKRPRVETQAERVRIAKMPLDMWKDDRIRKELKKYGLNHNGNRSLCIWRLTEWTTLWNASLDSKEPLSKASLLARLNENERSHLSIKNKKEQMDAINSEEHMQTHKNEFQELIEEVRAKRKQARDAQLTAEASK